ncbi:MAG: hypothetical protein AAF394_14305, partial [Planctomycetota bacterium]
IEYATQLGYHIKHLGLARLTDAGVEARVHPTLKGVLALQLHAGKAMWAEFKDIRIKELKD